MYRNRIRDYAAPSQNPAADVPAGFIFLPIPPSLLAQHTLWQQLYQAAFELACAAAQPQTFERFRKPK